MPTQQDLLKSAKAIDDRLSKAKSMVKEHKQTRRRSSKSAEAQKAKAEARADGRLI